MALAFNIGRDVSLDISDPIQGLVRFGIRTGAEFTPIYDELKSKALDGIPRNASIPDGHRIMIQIDRNDARLDNYFATKEANYFAGNVDPNVTITETITEIDGSTTVWRYTDVSIRLTSGGVWKGNAITTLSIEGVAARKVKIQ